MKTTRLLPLLLAAAVLSLAIRDAGCQDDSYHPIQFVNESAKAVEIKVWNPRSERKANVWKIEAGKTFDFVDEAGKKLKFGIYSSLIVVNDKPETSLVSVATQLEDGTRQLVWTEAGFKAPPKAP